MRNKKSFSHKSQQTSLIWTHLLPLGMFTAVLAFSGGFVTGCSPQSQSLLKNAQLGEVKSNSAAQNSDALSLSEMKVKLPGTWSDSSTEAQIIFNKDLTGVTLDHTITLEGEQGACHIKHEYKMTYKNSATSDNGTESLDLLLSTNTLGQLIEDTSNSDDCADHFKTEVRPNLVITEKLAHLDDWSEITFKGHKYRKIADSAPPSQTPSPSSGTGL